MVGACRSLDSKEKTGSTALVSIITFINRLLIDNELCSIFGASGIIKVKKKYNWTIITRDLENILVD